jgi:WD40 repeat protein
MNSRALRYRSKLATFFSAQPLFFDCDQQKKPNIRKCMEQPFQQTKAQLWDEVTDTLCNLDFIQAKACANMTYDLVKDFNAVLQVIPDNSENIREENERKARMDKYTRNLISYAKGEITELEIPETVPVWSKEHCDAELERMKTNSSRLDCLKDFKNFLGQEANNLQIYASEFVHFTWQQAWNHASEGPVGKAAGELTPAAGKSLLRQSKPTRPPWNPSPQVLKILKGHTACADNETMKQIFHDLRLRETITGSVNAVSIIPNGQRALSGSKDTTCIYWDLTTGEALQILKGHTGSVKAVSITPDGKRAISGSEDCTCILWDLITGDDLQTLKGHNDSVTVISVTPDGRRAISGSNDKTCILWDLTTGKVLQTFNGHTDKIKAVSISPDGHRAISYSSNCSILWNMTTGRAIWSVKEHLLSFKPQSITPDGRRLISGAMDYCSVLWDVKKGKELRFLAGHTDYVNASYITPDGQRAISGSNDKTCIVWNLNTGMALQTLKGHTDSVIALSVTMDGRLAISGSNDKTCIIWDLTTGKALQTLKGHSDSVNALSITPDGQLAVSRSNDKTCIIWNLKNGEKVGIFSADSGVNSVSFFPGGVFGREDFGRTFVLDFPCKLLCPHPSIVTIRRIWDFKLHRHLPLSADCPLCGYRFAPLPSVLVTIGNITKKAGLKPEQSPCLDLPDEAWEEPGLLANCPKCGGELKFNPFIVGGDNKPKTNWKFWKI